RWRQAFRLRARPYAPEMDERLQAERLNGRKKRTHRRKLDDAPDGAMIELDGEAWAVRGNDLLHWTPKGYGARKRRRHGVSVDVLTPPAIIGVLAAGYQPHWHPS